MIKHSIFPEKNSTKKNGLLYLILICLTIYLLYFLLTPKIGKLNSLKNQLTAVNDERASYEQLYKKYLDYDKTIAEYNDLIKKVPLDDDLPKFIIDIEEWCQNSDISLISIVPQETKTEQIEEIEVSVLSCEITMNGNFDLLLAFVGLLENYSRVCRINELHLSGPSGKDSSPSSDWKLTVNISLYYITPTT